MITVKFYSLLRIHLQTNELQFSGRNETVLELLRSCEKELGKEFISLLAEDRKINDSTIILLNGRNVKHLQGLDTPLEDDDVLSVFPPAGGG